MYHTPAWYASLRDVSLLWEALGGVFLFWQDLPKRKYWCLICLVFWLPGAAMLLFFRRHGLMGFPVGTNVFIIYFLSVFMVRAVCRVSAGTAWMIGSAGFLAQQISGNLELAFRTIPAVGRMVDFSNRIVLLDVVFYLGTYFFLGRIFRNNGCREDGENSNLQKIFFSLLATLFSLGYYSVNQYVRGWENLSTAELTTGALYVSVGGIFLLIMQYGLNRQERMNAEFHSMQAMLHAQGVQWQNSKDLTELVNEKYHDLKKLIRSLQGNVEPRYLNVLTDAVEAYDDQMRTGSQVADVVLTEGRELCRKHGIQFTCYVNGADFNVLEDMDFYSILKNALDNAIEAVQRLPEGQERFISMTGYRDSDFIVLHTENPCNSVVFVNGLPQTGKNTDYHGFGVKSMMSVAEKYGGTLTCTERNGIFYLDVLLMPENG